MSSFRNFVICAFAVFALAPLVSAQSDQCTTTGLKCSSDCQSIEYCTSADSPPLILQTCESNEKCATFDDNGKKTANCSVTNKCSPSGETYPIICPGYGIFTDPNNCSIAYQCSTANKPPDKKCTCPNKTLYSHPVQGCRKEIQASACCPTPTTCDSLGHVGCIGKNDGDGDDDDDECGSQGCYICLMINKTMVPQPVKCPTDGLDCGPPIITDDKVQPTSGGYFRSTNSNFMHLGKTFGGINTRADPECVPYQPPNEGGNGGETTTTERDGGETTTTERNGGETTTTERNGGETTTTERNGGETTTTERNDPTCAYPGQLIADPNDCHGYYRCSSTLQPVHKTCPNNYYFTCNPICGCVKGTCTNP